MLTCREEEPNYSARDSRVPCMTGGGGGEENGNGYIVNARESLYSRPQRSDNDNSKMSTRGGSMLSGMTSSRTANGMWDGFNSGQGYFPFYESLFGAPLSDVSDDNSLSADSAAVDADPYKCFLVNKRTFTFMLWNINGLRAKLYDNDFVSFVCSFNFICLVETFVIDMVTLDMFNDFKAFCQPAIKFSGPGRPSGGVICLIKKEIMPFVRQLDVKLGNFLLFVVDKTVWFIKGCFIYVRVCTA